MTSKGFVDWRGKPFNKTKHGGVRATYFIHLLAVLGNIAIISNLLNLVTYLRSTMHTGLAESSNFVTNYSGARSVFSLFAAFLSDSYITRFKTLLIFLPLDVLGYGLLSLQAHFPKLHPAQCNIAIDQGNNCEQIHGQNAALFYLAIYIVAFSEGCMFACLPSLGADQFATDDPVESRQQSSFFNWYTFDISIGGLIGIFSIVWLQNNKGWDIGFGACAGVFLVGIMLLASGLTLYRNQVPEGSPLTRMAQVFVVAMKKRNHSLPENLDELNQIDGENDSHAELLSHTSGFKFLDKASIITGKESGPWTLCTVTQVEETKIILRMIPIFISSVIAYTPYNLVLTLTVQQGSTMNTKLGKIHISSATLFVIPQSFQLVILIIYDRCLVSLLRKVTGYVGGITPLQRVSIGYFATVLSTCIAALVETKRLHIARQNGLQDVGTGVPMSVFWLTMQCFLVGVTDVTAFVGLLEFFNSEASRGMKSIGTSLFWLVTGLAFWLSSLLVELVKKVTSRGKKGWLEGSNLNKSHLDKFYWLLCVLELLALLVFIYAAKKYKYRHDPKIHDEKMASKHEEQGVI